MLDEYWCWGGRKQGKSPAVRDILASELPRRIRRLRAAG
jgi:hypothetical protein